MEAILNVCFSLLFVNIFGVYGVFLGTIIALLYSVICKIIYSNNKILHRSPWITLKRWGINVVVFIIIAFISNILDF